VEKKVHPMERYPFQFLGCVASDGFVPAIPDEQKRSE
jgi:hypothetical protein